MADELDPAPVEPVVAADPAPAPDPAPQPEPDPAPEPAGTRGDIPKWTLERIGEETSRRQAAEDAARVAMERAAHFEEITRRLQAQATPPAAGTEPARAAEPRQTAPDQSAVQQEAARQLLARDLENVTNAGAKAYGTKWADAVNALNACGANSHEFVASVIEIDPANAHEVMFKIAQDPDRAVALTRMSPTRRIAEITRMSVADSKTATAPAAPAVSRAPAPKPAIAPHAPAPSVNPETPEGNAKMTDAEFERWYKDKYYKRTA